MTEVIQQMLTCLDNAQLKHLKRVLEKTLFRYEMVEHQGDIIEDDSERLIAMFMAGCGYVEMASGNKTEDKFSKAVNRCYSSVKFIH